MRDCFMESAPKYREARCVGDSSDIWHRRWWRILLRLEANTVQIIRFLVIFAAIAANFVSQLQAAPRIESVDQPTVSVYFLDVGQGDAALVQTGDGKNLLIDAGPADSAPRLIARLSELGVTHLDAFVLTHPHADHIGGAMAVVKRFPAKAVLDPGYAHTSTVYAEFLEYIEKNGIAYRQPRKGLVVKLGVHAKFNVLAPEEPFLSGTRSDANSNSVVMMLHVGDVRVMLTGDAEADTERRILRGADTNTLDVDVLKVAHHGSAHSSTSAFLSYVKPEIAVISCSASNRYGHPAPEALHRLSATDAEIFVTAKHGDIVLHTDGKNYSIDTLSSQQRSVRPDALTDLQANGASAPNAPAGPPAGSAALPSATDNSGTLDINVAAQEEFETLPGIGPAKARAIIQLRQSKGGFSSVDDLREVKGIGAKTFDQLRPLVRVGANLPADAQLIGAGAPVSQKVELVAATPAGSASGFGGIDINTATIDDLLSLPGIGPSKANAIVDYRTQIGGFTNVDQLAEVKGIGPKTLDTLRPLVHVGGQIVTRAVAVPLTTSPRIGEVGAGLIDLNTASEDLLCTLPGIGPAKARAILQYRSGVGRFDSVEQLTEVRGIGQKTLEQLRPLVSVGQSGK